MKHTRTAIAARHHGPNRILIALAAAWMILSLAIGGAVGAEAGSGPEAQAQVTSGTQP